MTKIDDLPTPALVADGARLEANLRTMAEAHPGAALRPHVKAHKCTALAKRQAAHGHRTFCAATTREIEGMAAAGLGDDDPALLVLVAGDLAFAHEQRPHPIVG